MPSSVCCCCLVHTYTVSYEICTYLLAIEIVGKDTGKAGSALKLSFLASLNPSRWARMNADRYKVFYSYNVLLITTTLLVQVYVCMTFKLAIRCAGSPCQYLVQVRR